MLFATASSATASLCSAALLSGTDDETDSAARRHSVRLRTKRNHSRVGLNLLVTGYRSVCHNSAESATGTLPLGYFDVINISTSVYICQQSTMRTRTLPVPTLLAQTYTQVHWLSQQTPVSG